MFKKIFFSVIIATIFYLNLNAQIMEKEYPELEQVMPYGPARICKTNDNGFAFVGYSNGNNVYMVKLNSEYEIEWHKQVYARPGQTDTKNLVQDDKGYFYIGGSCYDDVYNMPICYLVKLDSLGNMVKERIWRPENSKSSGIVNFVLAKDGLMVLNSVHFENVENHYFIYTTFLNKDLEIMSEKQREKILCGTKSFDEICSDENGFLLIGHGSGLHLIKIENDSIVWEKTIDNTVQDSALYRFIPLNCQSVNNAYLIGGHTKNYKPGLVLIDKQGNLIWVKEFNVGSNLPWYYNIQRVVKCWESKYHDGYIMVCNDDRHIISANTLVIKLNYDGQIMWQQELSGGSNDVVYLENGNIVCIGRTQQSITCLKVFFHDIVKVDTEPIIPESILLFQNYPNPFNASTTICFDLPYDRHVILKIYDIAGREISALINEKRKAGYYSVIWNPGNVASGMYIYRLIANQKMICKKLILEK